MRGRGGFIGESISLGNHLISTLLEMSLKILQDLSLKIFHEFGTFFLQDPGDKILQELTRSYMTGSQEILWDPT